MAQLSAFHFRLARVGATIGATAGLLSNVGVFVGVALLVGIGSSWYMIDQGSRLTTRRIGPWVTWSAAARLDADPYTRARFARLGSLPLSAEIARSYEARVDGDGQRLHSSCEYILEGDGLEGGWWSLSVFDDKGRLIPNPAERYAFNNHMLARGPDGSFIITLAREARPGNWMPIGGGGRIMLVLITQDQTAEDSAAEAKWLPLIRRAGCR